LSPAEHLRDLGLGTCGTELMERHILHGHEH
jgi:hypothetical protein